MSPAHRDIGSQANTPILNGLVLAGGRSVRMGVDKSALQWNGKEQRYYIADLLQQFCNAVFISCRAEQQQQLAGEMYRTIPDSVEGLGPFGGILSAFQMNKECAWLVAACDLPLLDRTTILQLVAERDTDYVATAFECPGDRLPEPLLTIWEPKSYPILLASFEEGFQSLRRVLINHRVKIIPAKSKQALINVNTPEEMENVQAFLSARKTGPPAM